MLWKQLLTRQRSFSGVGDETFISKIALAEKSYKGTLQTQQNDFVWWITTTMKYPYNLYILYSCITKVLFKINIIPYKTFLMLSMEVFIKYALYWFCCKQLQNGTNLKET